MFRDADWFRKGSPELDAAQAARDPPASSDLRGMLSDLQRVADECGRSEGWTYPWTREVLQAIDNPRPRKRQRERRGPVQVVVPLRDRQAVGPRELLRAYAEMDSARALLKTECGTWFWVDADRSRRIADSLDQSIRRADEALRALGF